MPAPRLIASYWTLAGDVLPLAAQACSPFELAERASVAAQAGWAGLGLNRDDLTALARRHGLPTVRSIVADSGLEYLELEALFDWFTAGARRAASDRVRHELLHAAQALGAWQIKVAGDLTGATWPLDQVTEEFARLCREAAEVGAQVSLELIAESSIADLRTGLAIVAGAGAANGGLLLDIWHVARAGVGFAEIARMPRSCLKHVELSDAGRRQVGSMLEDTIRRRKLPGEGDLDIPGFIEAVQATGYAGCYGVEIVSDEQRARSLRDAARLPMAATLAQFNKVRVH